MHPKILTVFLILISAISNCAQQNENDRKMNQPVEPFRIIGNIYYVGASDVTSYLITTPEGHILIDAGFEETVPQIKANVARLGFKLEDIKILLINHEHYDHAGGLKVLKEKTGGAKLYASREAAKQLEKGGRDDFRFGDDLSFTPVAVDKIIDDKENVKLGGVRLKTLYTPGHTKGCTTFTTEIEENKKNLNVMFLCSTSTLDYNLVDNKNYPNIAEDFTNTFTKLKKIPVDVFLSSHAQFFNLKEKFEKMKNGSVENPFIDAEGYQKFVERMEKQFLEKLAKQKI